MLMLNIKCKIFKVSMDENPFDSNIFNDDRKNVYLHKNSIWEAEYLIKY